MSNQPASDRALRGALSLPGVNAGASRANLVISPPLRAQEPLKGGFFITGSKTLP